MASTWPTRWRGCSASSSRVPVARPRTATPARIPPAGASTTVQPVAVRASVQWPTVMPATAARLRAGDALIGAAKIARLAGVVEGTYVSPHEQARDEVQSHDGARGGRRGRHSPGAGPLPHASGVPRAPGRERGGSAGASGRGLAARDAVRHPHAEHERSRARPQGAGAGRRPRRRHAHGHRRTAHRDRMPQARRLRLPHQAGGPGRAGAVAAGSVAPAPARDRPAGAGAVAGARGGGAHPRPGGAHGDHRRRGAQRARRGEWMGRRNRGRAPAGEGAGARARRSREGRPETAPLGAGLRLRLLLAGLTARHPPERTNQAEEGAAVGAGIALRGPLFVAAGAAGHRVVLLPFRLVHGSPQRAKAYTLILLISVAREMPSSWAARVRLPPWKRRARSMCCRSTSASVSGRWRRSPPLPPAPPPPPPTPPAPPGLRGSAGRCSGPGAGGPRAGGL